MTTILRGTIFILVEDCEIINTIRHVRMLYLDVAGKIKKVFSQTNRYPTHPGSTESMVPVSTASFGYGARAFTP